MKLQSYEPQVRMSQPKSAAVVVNNDVNAYGNGSGTDLRDLSQAVNKWTVELDKQIESEDRASILKAMDVYNNGRYDIMYNEKDGLMNTKGEGASGISQAYRDKTNMLRSQVLDTFKVQKKANLDGLINSMNTSAQQGFVAVNRHQYREGENVKNAALDNNITSIANLLQKDYKSPNAINDALLNARLAVSLRYGDAGKEIIDAANKKAEAEILGTTISGAIAQSDYKSATAMLHEYGDMITPQQKVQFTNTLQQKGSQEHTFSLGRTAFQMFGNNEAGALEWLRNQPGFSLSGDAESRPMSAAEYQQAQNIYLNEVNTNKRIESEFLNNSIMQFGESVYKMFTEGKNLDEAMEFARAEAGNNVRLMRGYNAVVRSYYSNSGSGGADKFTKDGQKLCTQLLTEGRFPECSNYVQQVAFMGGSATDQLFAMKEWKDWRYGTGKFKYSGKELLEFGAGKRYNNLSQDEKAVMERAVHDAVGSMIADYQIQNKKDPTEFEVIEMSKKAMTLAQTPGLGDTGFWDFGLKSSPAALRMAGIIKVVPKNTSTNEITLDDGTTRIVTDAELKAMIKGSTRLAKYRN